MHTVNRAAAFKLTAIALVLFLYGSMAQSASFAFKKTQDGLIEPFKIKEMKLADFVRAYSDLSGIAMETDGSWNERVKGKVTLFVRHPIQQDVLAELFHQALFDNQYSVIDAPHNSGWIIARTRDAKDGAISTYDSTNFPDTYRLITVVHTLKRLNADEVSRVIRNFMPPNSRIISLFQSQLIITTAGRYIKSLIQLIDHFDSSPVSPVYREFASKPPSKKSCDDRQEKIEKLVVEKLEINEMSQNSGFSQVNQPTGKMQGGHRK